MIRYSEQRGFKGMGRSVLSDSVELDPPLELKCLQVGCGRIVRVRKICGFIGVRCEAGHVSCYDSLAAMTDESLLPPRRETG